MSNSNENIPTIRIELEHMRQRIYTAFLDHQFKLDSMVQEAIEAYLSEGNLQSVLRREAQKCIEESVSSEVNRFLCGYGQKGNNLIRKAVRQHLLERFGPELVPNSAGLLPCPFCHSTDTEVTLNGSGWPVGLCNDCGATGPAVHNDPALAAADWNKRGAE